MVLNMEKHKVPKNSKLKKISFEKYKRSMKYLDILTKKFNEKYKDYEKDKKYLEEVEYNLTFNRCMQMKCSSCGGEFTSSCSNKKHSLEYHYNPQNLRFDLEGNWLCHDCFVKKYNEDLISYIKSKYYISNSAPKIPIAILETSFSGDRDTMYVNLSVNGNFMSVIIYLNRVKGNHLFNNKK